MSDTAAAVRWLLALELIAWGLYPYLYLATPGLRDRGLTFARPFGLLLLVYPVWFLAALGLPVFTAPVLLAALIGLAAAGWSVALHQRFHTSADRRSGTDARAGAPGDQPSPWRGGGYLLASEALFLASFAGYLWLRGFNPEILGTEKPMEIGFLSAATRATTMPPNDPWLSGHGINYYYLGYTLVAAVAKLTGVSSSLAFNLGLATVFAATLTAGTGLTANLLASVPGSSLARVGRPRLRALGAGLPGGYLLALAGNMYAARDILERGRAAIDAWWWGGLGWKSSRVVVDRGFPAGIWGPDAPPVETITEFPFFSFLLGDLHAHVLALPFTVLALALAYDVLVASPLGYTADRAWPATRSWRAYLPDRVGLYRLTIAALVVGALYALNSWDLPTFAAIYAAALVLPSVRRGEGITPRLWAALALFAALCLVLYSPFHANFTSLVGGEPLDLPEPWGSMPLVGRLSSVLGLVIWAKTPADQFLTVYLLPWTVALLYLTWRWRGRRRHGAGWQTPALAALGLAFGATLLQMPVLFLAGLPVALALALLPRGNDRGADTFAALLCGVAFTLVLVTEVFFVHDVFGNRMNTIFKVYYQAWTLLAIAGGYALVRAIFDLRRWRDEGFWRVPAVGAATLLLLASAAYPTYGSSARTDRFAERKSLDGLAFVAAAAPEEYAAIRWVRDNIPAGTVVAEAPGCPYGEWRGLPHNRVSAFTGLSTPLGWGGHEQQWRGGSRELLAALGPRGADVNALYSTTDPEQAQAILDRYDIAYVYVGLFERQGYAAGGIGADCRAGGAYPAAGLAKFDALMERVYQSDRGLVTIYRRR